MAEFLPPVVQKLELDASDYTKGYDKAEGKLDEFGKKSSKTSEQFKKDQKDQGKAVSDFERLLGSKLQEGETGLQSLQREMETTTKKVGDLRKAAAKTGNESLFGDLKKAEADLKGLTSIAETIAPDLAKDIGKSGSEAGTTFSKEFLTAFDGTPIKPVLIAILAGVAIAGAPTIAAIINGAVLTGMGLGGFAIGFAEAIKDPRVHSTLDGLTSQISSELKNATSGFDVPIAQGLSSLSAIFAREEPGLKSTFDTLAQAAGPLLDGFGQFIEDALPGLEEGFKAAEPVLVEFADLLPSIGEHLGGMFKSFGDGAPGAAAALHAIVGVLNNTLDLIGWIMRTGSSMFLWMENAIADVLDVAGTAALTAAKAFSWVPVLGDDLQSTGTGLTEFASKIREGIAPTKDAGNVAGYAGGKMSDYAGKTKDAVQELQDLVDATNTWINAAQGSDDALLAMKTAQSDFYEGITKGAKNWDENTRAGQKNVAFLNAYNEKITVRFDKMAALHPLTQAQLKDEIALEQKLYDDAKAAGASNDELATLGITIGKLKAELAKLNGSVATYYVKGIETHTAGGPVLGPGSAHATFSQGGSIKAAAQGLISGVLPPRSPGTLIRAGEMQTHGEVLTPLAGISAQRAMGLSQVVGDAYGFDAVPKGRMAAYAGGDRGGVQTVIPTIVVQLGGKQMAVIHGGLMQYSQRFKLRTGTTGLT